ncbi:hypothetical protein GN956_G16883 [Arapaima gigas]
MSLSLCRRALCRESRRRGDPALPETRHRRLEAKCRVPRPLFTFMTARVPALRVLVLPRRTMSCAAARGSRRRAREIPDGGGPQREPTARNLREPRRSSEGEAEPRRELRRRFSALIVISCNRVRGVRGVRENRGVRADLGPQSGSQRGSRSALARPVSGRCPPPEMSV